MASLIVEKPVRMVIPVERVVVIKAVDVTHNHPFLLKLPNNITRITYLLN
jgi:hypothetical protein